MPNFTYRPLAFISPQTKTRIEFLYDGTLSDGKTHNLGEFQFAGKDEKYFQDRSLTSDAYGFNILLDNQDDLRIVRALLDEKVTQDNPGTLEHPDPTLGTFPVVVSSYAVDQNSVNKIGIIRISVVFFRQIPNLIGGDPSESNNPASAAATLNTIFQLNIEQAEDMEISVDLSTGQGTASLVEGTVSAVEGAQEFLGSIAAQVDAINILFTNLAAEILSTVDELARAPFDLARQVQNLIQLPMLAVDSATDRIAAYTEYVNSVMTFDETQENEFTAGSPSGASTLSIASTAALAAISAINYSAVSTKSVTLDEIVSGENIPDVGYLSRRQIIETIQAVQSTAFETTAALSQFAADFGADTFFSQYFDYSILNKNLITATVRNLNGRIFSTSQEIIIVLDKERHPVDLSGELYGSVEVNTVEFLVSSNQLHGDDIYLIPKGKEIVFYG